MTTGMANVVEVVVFAAGPHALLTARSRVVGPLFAAEEDILELVHARVDEEQRGILGRNQRRAFDNRMAAVCEELEESPANLVAIHGAVLFPLEWRPHHIQDEAEPEKDERHRGIRAAHAISNCSF